MNNLIIPAVVAPVVATAAADSMSDKNAQTATAPAPAVVAAPPSTPVQPPTSTPTSTSASTSATTAAPVQAPAPPPASTSVQASAPAPTSAPSAPAPTSAPSAPATPTQIINKDTIQNAINNSLQKYPLEITDEKGVIYNMTISSNFSNPETPDFPTDASQEFKAKISNIQAAINNAVSCIKMVDAGNTPLKLNMKVTVTRVNQSGGGNKKMRQTKKMKKRKHWN